MAKLVSGVVSRAALRATAVGPAHVSYKTKFRIGSTPVVYSHDLDVDDGDTVTAVCKDSKGEKWVLCIRNETTGETSGFRVPSRLLGWFLIALGVFPALGPELLIVVALSLRLLPIQREWAVSIFQVFLNFAQMPRLAGLALGFIPLLFGVAMLIESATRTGWWKMLKQAPLASLSVEGR